MAELPIHNPDFPIQDPAKTFDVDTIIKVLDSYKVEAEQARDGGPNPRTQVWKANWDRYWGRYDFSGKASWQAKHVLPEVSQFVDRWAAAMREGWDASSDQLEIQGISGSDMEPLIPHIKRLMKAILGKCARTPDGHSAPFSSIFEEQMKLGAISALCASVTWQNDSNGGFVYVSSVDPREYWADPKQRRLYRRRHYEIDKHELVAMASKLDENGQPIYNLEQINRLSAALDERSNRNREDITGSGVGTDQGRTPIQIDEWLATVLDPQTGQVICDRALLVVANNQYLIRGPEVNPYWHNEDWIVFTPMVSVPLSLYGRSYMEDWADVADAFIQMSNLILDGAQTSVMKAYAAQPDMLNDPAQLVEGISPNKVFQMAEGYLPTDFVKTIDLGQLPQEAVLAWRTLKEELREGAKLSEIALGQMPNKTHISAEAVAQSAQSGSALIRSMAVTIETRWLEPVLSLIWYTALQYMDFMSLKDEIGEDVALMFQARRRDFMMRKFRFRFRGISGLIDRNQKLQSLIQFLSTVSQNPVLLQALMQKMNVPKLLQSMTILFGVDPKLYEYTEQELMDLQAQSVMLQSNQVQSSGSR